MALRPRIQRQSTFQSSPVDSNAGVDAVAFSEMVSQVGQLSNQVASQEAVRLGQLSGAEVKRDEQGNLETPTLKEGLKGFTNYGKAFNDATVASYSQAIDNDSRIRFAELAEEHKDDPAMFAEMANQYVETTLQDMPGPIQNKMRETLIGYGKTTGDKVREEFKARQDASNLANFQTHLTNLNTDIQNAVRSGDTKQAKAALNSYKRQINEAYKNGVITDPGVREQLKVEAETNFIVQNELANFENILFGNGPLQGRVDNATNYINEFMQTTVKGIDPAARDALVGKMWQMTNRQKAQIDKTKGSVSKEVATRFSQWQKATLNGLFVSDAEEMAIVQEIAPYPVLMKLYADTQQQAAFALATQEERENILSVEDAQGDLSNVDNVMALQTIHKGVSQNEIKKAVDLLKDYQDAVTNNIAVSEEDRQLVEQNIAQFPELQQTYERINEVMAFTEMPVQERVQIINDTNAGDLDGVRRQKAMRETNASVNAMYQNDPIAAYQSQFPGQIEPLDLSNLNTLREQINFRMNNLAGVVQAHSGFNSSGFTQAEINNINQLINQSTPEEKTNLAMAFQGDNKRIWKALGKDNALFAMAGETGDQAVMQSVFNGSQKMKERLVTMPQPSDYMQLFDDQVKGIYNVEDKAAVLKASLAYYAEKVEDQNGIIDRYLFEQSINAVTGGTGSVNGANVELPRGVPDNIFSDYVNNMTPTTVNKLGGVAGLTNEQAAALIQNATLRSHPNGGYVVDTQMGTLMSAKDPRQPFVFKYDQALNNAQQGERYDNRKRRLQIINRANPYSQYQRD